MKLNILFLILIFPISLFSQNNGINYKALIHDINGDPLANTNVTVQFDILEGAGLTSVYSESHSANTDANGIVVVIIGEGTPVSGNYNTINWSSNEHALNVKIDSGSGLVDMGTNFFQSVPYALNVTGLSSLDEGNGTGWRMIGRNPDLFGNIGLGAIDLSDNDFNSNIDGATGLGSFASGYSTVASGNYSTAMGYNTDATNNSSTALGNESEASGQNSTAMGNSSVAQGTNSTAMGDRALAIGETSTAIGSIARAGGKLSFAQGEFAYSDAYLAFSTGRNNVGGGDGLNWVPTDPLFEVGNGADFNNKSNALTILKNGTILAPTFDPNEITSPKALITKEYADANYTGGTGGTAPTGLEAIDEGNGIGWRFIGRNPANYANIGSNAVDLSFSNTSSLIYGATGSTSLSTGFKTTASGHISTALGYFTTAGGAYSTSMGAYTDALGENSTAMGLHTQTNADNSVTMGAYTVANDPYSTVMGKFNAIINPTSPSLFIVGNGISVSARSNALEVFENGTITAPSLDVAEIISPKSLVTKEYGDANYIGVSGASKINELSDGKSDDDGTENGSSVFLGIDAGLNDDGTNNKNVGVGFEALTSNTTGNLNSAYGHQALFANTTGVNNTANGFRSLYSNTSGHSNTAVGDRAMQANTTGYSNTAFGTFALNSNTTGVNNIALGYQALRANTIGQWNTANGYYALGSNTSGNQNTANGGYALSSNISGFDNTAMGYNSLRSNTIGNGNTANGFGALYFNTSGNQNTANGIRALYSNNTGSNNTANGNDALYSNTSGYDNSANGRNTLHDNTTGYWNTASGANALANNTIGKGNTAIGSRALDFNISGDFNTAIGFQAGYNSEGSGNIFIGSQAGQYETGSDKLYIDNTTTVNPLIYGDLDNDLLTVHGNVGIGTKGPSTKFQIVGGTDASYNSTSGYMVLGATNTTNIVIDNNEIMARNNGASSPLYLQNSGGDVYVGGGLVHSSDRRLKKDIQDLEYGLSEILQLAPKQYKWKNRNSEQNSLGLIAQDVQPIIDEIVKIGSDEQNTLSVNYTELIPVLINAIQEQQLLIEGQNKKIIEITAELQALKSGKNE